MHPAFAHVAVIPSLRVGAIVVITGLPGLVLRLTG